MDQQALVLVLVITTISFSTGLCCTPSDPCEEKAQRNSDTRFIGGFFVGWAVFFTLFFAIGLFTPVEKIMTKFMKRQPIEIPRFVSLPSREIFNTKISMLDKYATRMSFLELSNATDNFSENNVISIAEIGTTIYRAMLSNGWCLAIKRLSTELHIENEFLTEIKTLGRLRHSNLVPLIGFCHELNDRFLIYKFIPKGSLHDCLFPANGESNINEWALRVRIAVGIAKGIAWLHENRVVHRGITSKCILLDENFEPKISDFGKATSAVRSKELSVYMEDVHSFGILLLELFTGTKYSEIISTSDITGDIFHETSHLFKEPHVLGVYADHSVIKQGFEDEIIHFIRIAGKCLECDPGNWPSMEEVYQMLIGTKNP